MNIFRYDSKIIMFLSRVFDLILLNVLWIACSLPIITIGAATTALYYSLFNIVRDEDYGIIKMFFHSFLQNIKQSCVLTLILLATGSLLFLDLNHYLSTNNILGSISKIIVFILLIIWGIFVSYVFPLLARFENTTKNILKNAMIIGLSNMPKTMAIILLNSVPMVLILWFPTFFLRLLPFWLALGFSVIAYLNTKNFKRIFEKYISEM